MEISMVNYGQLSFKEEEEDDFSSVEEEYDRSSDEEEDDLSSDEDDDKISEAYKQVIEINKKENLSPIEYQAELEKRGVPFEFGLVDMYLRKFPFEDEEYLPNSFYYYNEKGHEHINAHELVKRFLKQVRESNGYDVDCFPAGVYSPFFPAKHQLNDKGFYDEMMELAHIATKKINAQTGKTYEPVVIENALYTTINRWDLLTFTVKQAGTNNDAPLEAIQAMMYVPYPEKELYRLEEWKLKPSNTDISGVDIGPGKKKARIGESTCDLVGLDTLAIPILEHIFAALDKRSAINLSSTCKHCSLAWVSLNKSST